MKNSNEIKTWQDVLEVEKEINAMSENVSSKLGIGYYVNTPSIFRLKETLMDKYTHEKNPYKRGLSDSDKKELDLISNISEFKDAIIKKLNSTERQQKFIDSNIEFFFRSCGFSAWSFSDVPDNIKRVFEKVYKYEINNLYSKNMVFMVPDIPLKTMKTKHKNLDFDNMLNMLNIQYTVRHYNNNSHYTINQIMYDVLIVSLEDAIKRNNENPANDKISIIKIISTDTDNYNSLMEYVKKYHKEKYRN